MVAKSRPDLSPLELAEMMDRIRREARFAIAIRASLDSANDVVENLGWVAENAYTFRMDRHARMLMLALLVAKIIETPGPGRHDVASVPEALKLLERSTVRRSVLAEWTDCRARLRCARSIRAAQQQYIDLMRRLDRSRLGLRDLRNLQIAHILMKDPADKVFIKELFELMDGVLPIFEALDVAIDGMVDDFAEAKRNDRRIADDFWRPALHAAKSSAQGGSSGD